MKQTHKRYSLTKLSVVVPISVCPNCGTGLDRALGVNKKGELIHAHPATGDYTVCMMCAAWLVFKQDLSMRPPTIDELIDMTADVRAILHHVTRTIKSREQSNDRS